MGVVSEKANSAIFMSNSGPARAICQEIIGSGLFYCHKVCTFNR